MRIARRRYETAKKEVSALKLKLAGYEGTIHVWEKAVKHEADPSCVVAINISKDGEVTLETRRKKEDTNGQSSPGKPAAASTEKA